MTVIPVKMATPTERPIYTWLEPQNHVLDRLTVPTPSQGGALLRGCIECTPLTTLLGTTVATQVAAVIEMPFEVPRSPC